MEIEDSQRGENPFDEPTRKLRDSDPSEVARRAHALWEPDREGGGKIVLPVLSSRMSISFPDVSVEAQPEVNSFSLKLLALLYLAGSDGSAPSGKWVAYRELAGGRFYEPVVKRSVEDPLAARFGEDLGGFMDACAAAGGQAESLGDAACSFNLYPNVRLAFLLWRGDEEFDARVQVLFDSNSTHHLNAFDLRMGSAEVASKLIKWQRGEQG